MPAAVTNLFNWFITSLPQFFMTEPIIYFWALVFPFGVIALLKRIINISR